VSARSLQHTLGLVHSLRITELDNEIFILCCACQALLLNYYMVTLLTLMTVWRITGKIIRTTIMLINMHAYNGVLTIFG